MKKPCRYILVYLIQSRAISNYVKQITDTIGFFCQEIAPNKVAVNHKILITIEVSSISRICKSLSM